MPDQPDKLPKQDQAKGPGQPSAAPLSERCLDSIHTLLDHLKQLAMPPEAHAPAGSPASVLTSATPSQPAVSATPTELPAITTELKIELTRTVRAQLAVLERRLDSLQLLVVINEWPIVKRLWWDLAFDMKMPLLQLNFLRELSQPLFDALRIDNHSPMEVLDRVGLLYAEIEFILIQQGDLIELSNVLEYRLAPELRKLRQFLERVEITSVA